MRALPLLLALAVAACTSPAEGPVAKTGDLSTADETLTSGEFRDLYTVPARAGQWIKVDLLSNAFRPYLILRTPGGDQVEDDGAAGGRADRSVVVYQADEAGRYEVSVTSAGVGETGAYVLVYEVLNAPPADAAGSLPPGHPSIPDRMAPPVPRPAPRGAPRVGPPYTDEEIGEGVRI